MSTYNQAWSLTLKEKKSRNIIDVQYTSIIISNMVKYYENTEKKFRFQSSFNSKTGCTLFLDTAQ